MSDQIQPITTTDKPKRGRPRKIKENVVVNNVIGRPKGSKNKSYNMYKISEFDIINKIWIDNDTPYTIPEISNKINITQEIIRNLIFHKDRCRNIYKVLYKIIPIKND